MKIRFCDVSFYLFAVLTLLVIFDVIDFCVESDFMLSYFTAFGFLLICTVKNNKNEMPKNKEVETLEQETD